MANDSKKISELAIATALSANDRVVVLSNPNTASANVKTITVGNFGIGMANNLPKANSSQVGVVKAGNNITIDANGAISTPGLPSTNVDSTGYVLTTNSSGNPAWQQFGGVFNVVSIIGLISTFSNFFNIFSFLFNSDNDEKVLSVK